MDTQNPIKPYLTSRLFFVLCSVLIFSVAAWARTYNIDWDEGTHLHPDERYLTMVVSALDFPEDARQYWNTFESPLNPANLPQFASYVYGTLPLFATRAIAGWVDLACGDSPAQTAALLRWFLLGADQPCHSGLYTGYSGIHLVGRALSALADLATLLGLMLLAKVLYNRNVALLAGAFYACAALPIQHAHFFVVDSYATVFVVWTLYFAASAVQRRRAWLLLPAGIATGLAVASKVSVWPVAGIVALATFLRRDTDNGKSRYRFAISPGALLAAVVSGVLATVTFRSAQPYAFTGPGFFGIRINPHWMDTMRDARDLASGLRDVPFGHQWTARAPVIFPLRNMVFWGLGVPLGLAAWIGWAVMGWRIVRHRRFEHLLIWAWGTLFFLYQGTQWVKSMRYLLPVYPVFALFAAWGLVRDVTWVRGFASPLRWWQKVTKPVLRALPVIVLAGAILWMGAFLQIYGRSLTRVEASRWMYDNIPTAVTIHTEAGERIQTPMSRDKVLSENLSTMPTLFTMKTDGTLTHVTLNKVSPGDVAGPRTLQAVVATDPYGERRLAETNPTTVNLDTQTSVAPIELPFSSPLQLMAGQQVYLTLNLLEGSSVKLYLMVTIYTNLGSPIEVFLPPDIVLSENFPATAIPFTVEADSALTHVTLNKVSPGDVAGTRTFQAIITADPYGEQRLAETQAATVNLGTQVSMAAIELTFSSPVQLMAGQQVYLTLNLLEGSPVRLHTSIIANEHWDDALPQRLNGKDAFGSWYRGLSSSSDGSMHNYDNDTPGKRQELLDWLDDADYIALSSNRLYASISRLPTRYPFTIAYYEALMNGSLGFELLAEFVSYPALGPCQFPDQERPFALMTPRYTNARPCSIPHPPAEEAYSVYDHPAVLLFAKTPAYSRERAEALLPESLLADVQWMTPLQATRSSGQGDHAALMMTDERRAEQQAGGTWSQLFTRNAPQNRSQLLAVILWWLMLAALGWVVFPWLYYAFPALQLRGYGLARAVGLLAWSYLAWILASLHLLPYTRLLLWAIFVLMAVVSAAVVRARWTQFRAFFAEHWRDLLRVEIIFMVLYVAWVYVRYLNPDLWHPVAGGEKPMDFAYLNAIIKSMWFPPYDPWFGGGSMNYYYFGFVMVGSLIKALGIVPSVGYNLAVPALYAMTGVGAYTVASNLAGKNRKRNHRAGLIGLLMVLVLGNLGELKLIFTGLEQIGGVDFESLIPGYPAVVSALVGLWKAVIGGETLMFRPEWWYWNATRVIPYAPGEVGAINEFPAFTFLYADLHAHMMAFPLTLVALAIALQWGIGRDPNEPASGKRTLWMIVRRALPRPLPTFVLAGLVTGALRATNTWDWPTYLALMSVGLLLNLYKTLSDRSADHLAVSTSPALANVETVPQKPLFPFDKLLTPILFVLLGELLFRPYVVNYITAYTAFDLWKGSRTTLGSYLIMHGQFLLPLGILAAVRGRDVFRRLWKARDASVLLPLAMMLIGVGVLWLVLIILKVPVAWAVIPLGAIASILVIDTHSTPRERLLWMWVGTALVLSLAVEIIVLQGDIGRMNTVFKFYLQVWMLLALSAAVVMERVLQHTVDSYRAVARDSNTGVPTVVTDVVAGLVGVMLAVTAMYPLLAIPAKARDRWAPAAPHSLDGMAFVPYATQHEHGSTIPLEVDERVIRWMQENVEGSPVIMEEQAEREYLWGNRVSVYTGLPSVAAWRWHSVQQRLVMPGGTVEARQRDIRYFYSTIEPERALDILYTYDVQYVILTPYEQAYMLPEGLPKFTTMVNRGWLEPVYQDEVSTVYRVIYTP